MLGGRRWPLFFAGASLLLHSRCPRRRSRASGRTGCVPDESNCTMAMSGGGLPARAVRVLVAPRLVGRSSVLGLQLVGSAGEFV
jgi:hypothetical protein